MNHIGARDLADLTARLDSAGLLVGVEATAGPVAIRTLVSDSREVEPGSVFAAVTGTHEDGLAYVSQALASGASALMVAGDASLADASLADASLTDASLTDTDAATVPVVRVSDVRRALGIGASFLAGDPSTDLDLTAVTGTNGKTTTAWILAQALGAAGRTSGFVGTTGWGLPDALESARLTTPGPVELQDRLARIRDLGASACAMEASSHALVQERLAGTRLVAGVFTNLTRDHLDYHGTPEAYLDAKALLFEGLGADALAVLNADDPATTTLRARTSARVVTYGTVADADIRFQVTAERPAGLSLQLDGHQLKSPLGGQFNAYNLAAAYTAMECYGIDPAERVQALAAAGPASGRFESIALPRDRTAIVDFAHTPDALENVLEAARRTVPAGARLWCVFGCGGDRDAGKRPQMGAIAERLADKVVVTNDNPRTEDPARIIADIRAGFAHPDRANWVNDRAEAVALAVSSAATGDVVLVAGKGSEPYQIVGTERLPYSDFDAIREAAGI